MATDRADPEFYESRRVHRDGRILIVPPTGHGNEWRGGRGNGARVLYRGRDGGAGGGWGDLDMAELHEEVGR